MWRTGYSITKKQETVLWRNRIQYYKEPGNSITEKQETVSWGCPIEPENTKNKEEDVK